MESLELRAPDGRRIGIHAFPHESGFLRDVHRAALAVGPEARDDSELRSLLEHALRGWYPRIEIHPRDDFGALSTLDVVWYVMRDGRVGKPHPVIDRMHTVLAQARETTAQSDAAMEHARAALERASRPARAGQTKRVNPAQQDDDPEVEHDRAHAPAEPRQSPEATP